MSSRKFNSGKYSSARMDGRKSKKKMTKPIEREPLHTDVEKYVVQLQKEIEATPEEKLFISWADVRRVRSSIDADEWFDLGVGSYEDFLDGIISFILDNKKVALKHVNELLEKKSKEKVELEKQLREERKAGIKHVYGLSVEEVISDWEDSTGYTSLLMEREKLNHDILRLKYGMEQKAKY